MGKTKIKVIDDSALVEKEKPSKKRVEKAERAKVGENVNLQEKSEISEEKVVVDDSADKTPPTAQGKSESSKIKKPGKAKPRSKKYQEKVQDLDRSKTYSIDEAVEMTKKLSYSKFTGTLEAHINTVQAGLRGLVSLPYVSGKTEYKTEAKAPIIHLGLGKLDQPTEQLSANVKILLQTVGKTRIKKVTLSPTMGPSVKVDLAGI